MTIEKQSNQSKRGGKRKGAGRKAGARNKRTAELLQKAEAGGLMPLDFLLDVMRNESADIPLRMDAAKAAAPFVHPKLANIEHSGKDGGPIVISATPHDEAL